MPNLSPVEDPKYQPTLPDMIAADSATEEPQLPELPVAAEPEDVASLPNEVTYNETGPLTEALGDNPANAKAFQDAANTALSLQEQMVDAATTAPPQVSIETPPVQEVSRLNKYDQAIADILATVKSGGRPKVDSDYARRALAYLEGSGQLKEAMDEAAGSGIDPTTLKSKVEGARNDAQTGGFSYDDAVEHDRGIGRHIRGPRHIDGGEEPLAEQTLGQTPDISEVEEKLSA